MSSRRLKSKYNPFHVYIWYTYILAWKIIYNPILVTVVFQLPSFVIDQNLQAFIWFSWFLSNIFCTKIYNPLFDQSNEFIHVLVFVFYYLSLLFYHIFAKHGFSVYGERSGSTPCSIVQVKMLFDLNSLWFDCVVFRAVLFFKFDVLYFCRFNFWNHYWPTEWNYIWWNCLLVLCETERNH